MRRREREAATQKESDHQRWADDGGFIPDPEAAGSTTPAAARNPWAAVAVAAGLGFVLGWLSGRR